MKTPNFNPAAFFGRSASSKLRAVRFPRRANSLVECLATLAIFGIGIGGLMTFNTNQLRCVRSTHEVTAASLCLQERVEQMRIANWRQLTDPVFIRDSFFAGRPACSAPISSLREELKITAYPDGTVCPPLTVCRLASGQAQILSQGTGLALEGAAKVVLDMSWTGQDGRNRKLQSVAVLSRVGVNRSALSASGPPAPLAPGNGKKTVVNPTGNNP